MAAPRIIGQDAVWIAVRTLGSTGGSFGLDEVMEHMAAARRPRLSADRRLVREYTKRLVAAGMLQVMQEGRYLLARDTGPKTPRLRPDGSEVERGASRRAIWRTMRILGQFTAQDVVKIGSTEEVKPSLIDVRKYISYLDKAGYVVAVYRPEDRTKPVTWRLVPSKSTGPLPPQIRRNHAVFDPNLGREVWSDDGEYL